MIIENVLDLQFAQKARITSLTSVKQKKNSKKKSTNKIQRGSEDLKKYFAEDRIQDLSKNNEY